MTVMADVVNPEDIDKSLVPLTEKEQTFLSVLANNPTLSNYAVGKKLKEAGVIDHTLSVYHFIRNPVVQAEAQEIRDLYKQASHHVGLKSIVCINTKLDHMAEYVPVEMWGKEERNWISTGLKAVPYENNSQTNIQVNFEARQQERRALVEEIRRVRAEGGTITVNEDK